MAVAVTVFVTDVVPGSGVCVTVAVAVAPTASPRLRSRSNSSVMSPSSESSTVMSTSASVPLFSTVIVYSISLPAPTDPGQDFSTSISGVSSGGLFYIRQKEMCERP